MLHRIIGFVEKGVIQPCKVEGTGHGSTRWYDKESVLEIAIAFFYNPHDSCCLNVFRSRQKRVRRFGVKSLRERSRVFEVRKVLISRRLLGGGVISQAGPKGKGNESPWE